MITIDELLMAAKEYNASDVHISVGVPPKMRVNGALMDMNYPKLFPEDTSAIITPILTQTQADMLNRKGEIDFSYSIAKAGRYRVNAYKQRGTISAAIRLVGTEIPKPSDLGIPKSVVDLINRQRGLVLVTGPTGSGKSTTLASILDQINETKDKHIITLEDPIEYLHSHKKSMVNQREIGTDSNSYATALRAALREDPDVILVGEMRDLETISIAVTAAETGHLVFSTLHTTGASSTIDRVIDVFPPHQQQQIRVQLAMVLECVVSQQLIARDRQPGRIAAFEVMHNTVAIKNLIRENKTYQINSIMQTSKKFGMQTMDDCLYDLYMAGHISAESALNYAQDMQVMTRRLSSGI